MPSTERRSRAANFRAPRKRHQHKRPNARPAVPVTPNEGSALDEKLDAAALIDTGTLPKGFAGIGLPEKLVTTLNRRGIQAPFAIQARTLPDALAGRDVLGRAQTGSGKTLAFGLPMLTRLAAQDVRRQPGKPRGLVLVPTRELAQQVTDAIAPLGHPLNIKTTAVYGGASMGRQISALRNGVDIVIATPGRLIDLIEQGECDLGQIDIAVLDEADYMADLGFMPAVTRILDLTPEGGQRLLFSATLDRGVDKLVRRYLVDPAFHAVAPAAAPIESVEHRVFTLRPEDKVVVAAEIAARPARTLYFVRTKHGADRLAKQFRRIGVEAVAIHGNLTQGARKRALESFANGSPRVLIATDVAARGIHVDDVDLVVHFDPSGDHKDYLHRSGRTARAGATGTVVSLVQHDQRREVARLHEKARVKPTQDDVVPGHAAVRSVATSGEAFVVKETRKTFDGASDKPRRDHRPRRTGNGPRTRSPRSRPRAARTA
jgi:superfamily II DNA/RNA helicase